MFFSRLRARIWRVTAPLRRFTKWCILLTTPIWLIPFIYGLIAGVVHSQWLRKEPARAWASLDAEISMHNFQSYMSVPGALTVHDYQRQKDPFQVPRISSLNWREELQVMEPGVEAGVPDNLYVTPYLTDLVRRDSYGGPKYNWVYVTSLAMPDVIPWDAAFRQLVEWRDAQPEPMNSTDLKYLDCASSSYLCTAWQIKQQHCMIMFEQLGDWSEVPEPEFLWQTQDEVSYSLPRPFLKPVRVKSLDLPFSETRDIVFPTGLASEFDQLRTLVTNPDISEKWYDYDIVLEVFDRVQEYGEFLDRVSAPWKLLHKVNDQHYYFLQGLVGEFALVGPVIHYTTLTITAASTIVLQEVGRQLHDWFLGVSSTQSLPALVKETKPEVNFMQDMFAGFMDSVLADIGNLPTESDDAGVTSTAAATLTDDLRSMMASAFSNVMSEASAGTASPISGTASQLT